MNSVFQVSLAALSNARVVRFRQQVAERMRDPPYNEMDVMAVCMSFFP